MSDLPRVMVGGPVRDREWSVPLWLGGLLGLDYPHDRLTLSVLVNDSEDLTLESVLYWSRLAGQSGQPGGAFDRIHIAEIELGTAVDNNVRRRTRDYLAFAQARDAWYRLRTDEDWFLAVDSDIQVPANLLSELLTLACDHGLAALAAVIDNSLGTVYWHTNVMQRRPDGSYTHDTSAWEPRPGVYPCALTGACWLLHRRVLDEGLTYAAPGAEALQQWGEDAPFCEALIDLGFTPHFAPGVRATHWMKAPEELSYLRDPWWHRRLAAYHDCRAHQEDADAEA